MNRNGIGWLLFTNGEHVSFMWLLKGPLKGCANKNYIFILGVAVLTPKWMKVIIKQPPLGLARPNVCCFNQMVECVNQHWNFCCLEENAGEVCLGGGLINYFW